MGQQPQVDAPVGAQEVSERYLCKPIFQIESIKVDKIGNISSNKNENISRILSQGIHDLDIRTELSWFGDDVCVQKIMH